MRLAAHNAHTGPMLARHYGTWWEEWDEYDDADEVDRLVDEVRRTGRVSAGSMWEAPFGDSNGAPLSLLEPDEAARRREQRTASIAGREERRRAREAARAARRAKYWADLEERNRQREEARAAWRAEEERRKRSYAAWRETWQQQQQPAWEPPQALLDAQVWWSQLNRHYADASFHYVSPRKPGTITTDGVTVEFHTGEGQWVPHVIAITIWSGGG